MTELSGHSRDDQQVGAPHFDEFGVVTTLQFVGCIDCLTEEGMAHACCQGLRCAKCHETHVGAPEDRRTGES